MEVAASDPLTISRDNVPQELVDKEKAIYADQVKGKPESIIEKILQGKLDAYFKQVCLLEQPFIKDTSIAVDDLIKQIIAKTGENITVARFTRYQLGEET